MLQFLSGLLFTLLFFRMDYTHVTWAILYGPYGICLIKSLFDRPGIQGPNRSEIFKILLVFVRIGPGFLNFLVRAGPTFLNFTGPAGPVLEDWLWSLDPCDRLCQCKIRICQHVLKISKSLDPIRPSLTSFWTI